MNEKARGNSSEVLVVSVERSSREGRRLVCRSLELRGSMIVGSSKISLGMVTDGCTGGRGVKDSTVVGL